MNSFEIEIAGQVIHVESIHTRPKAICRDFIVTDKKPDIEISITERDIDYDRKEYETICDNNDPWEGFLEVSTLCRLLTDRLIEFDTILLHGVAVAVGHEAFIFSAPSGIGKTTHALKWLKTIPDANIVNGDKPFLRFLSNGTVLVCGSPWAGKESIYTNAMIPLKSIVFMERAEDNHIEQISFTEAFPFLLQQVYHPDDKKKMRTTLGLLQRLNQTVSFWHFKCNNYKDNCFDVAYNALMRDKK